MKSNNRSKIVVSSIAAILLILLYCLIFSFSEQDGETSGGLSRMISEKCVEILKALSGKNWSELMMESMAEYFENPIRKLAHFCEYAVMGVLLFGIWYPWLGLKTTKEAGDKTEQSENRYEPRKKVCLCKRIPMLVKIIIPWVFVSAAFDEIHQLFIPGRCGNIWDVLLDTSGGFFGLLCCILGVKLTMRGKRRKKVRKAS